MIYNNFIAVFMSQPSDMYALGLGCTHMLDCWCLRYNHYMQVLIPIAVPEIKVMGMLISLLLTIPPDITTVADITPDDSVPLNVDDWNDILATVQ